MIEVKPGKQFSLALLKEILPDAETLFFFAKVYELDFNQLSALMRVVLQSDVARALTSGNHSTELQDYFTDGLGYDTSVAVRSGQISFDKNVQPGEILPELWKSLEIEVASSIKMVAEKLESVVGMMPGKQGSMVFNSMMVMNRRRPTIGDYKSQIHHAPQKQNLIVVDDSGSVTPATVSAMLKDIVALGYMANAHLALVSNDTRHWDPGTYNVDSVLAEVQGGGTCYNTLEDLLNRDWGTVVSIADYDARANDKAHLRRKCTGSIDELLDISLVSSPTFLAQCLGTKAKRVRPLLVGNSSRVMRA